MNDCRAQQWLYTGSLHVRGPTTIGVVQQANIQQLKWNFVFLKWGSTGCISTVHWAKKDMIRKESQLCLFCVCVVVFEGRFCSFKAKIAKRDRVLYINRNTLLKWFCVTNSR